MEGLIFGILRYYPMEIRPILDCALLVFLAGFFRCKILLETSILRVKTPKRTWGAVFNVRGPVTMYIEVGGGGESKFGCSLFVAV